MTRLVILCLAWMALSAATAYFADIWGRRLGKQRKTIGRLRPKHTAIVIITVSGALIAFLSFAVLLTADAGIRRALLHWDQTVAEKRALEAELVQQRQTLDAQIADRKVQVGQLQSQLTASQRQVAEAQAAVKDAAARLAASNKALAGSRQALASAKTDLAQASTRLASTQASLSVAKADLEKTQREAVRIKKESLKMVATGMKMLYQADATVRTTLYGTVAARAGDELARSVVPRGVSLTQARESLRRLLNTAGTVIQQRAEGAQYHGSQFVALRSKYFRKPGGTAYEYTTVSPDKSLELAAERLSSQRPGPGGTVVRVVAQKNTMAGETVPVDFELYENHLVFDKGQVITTVTVKASDGKPGSMRDLTDALQEVRKVALKNGMMPTADNSVGSLPAYQLPEVYSQVWRAFLEGQKTVTVRISAAQDTWTADQLQLRFDVRRYSEGT